MANQSLAYYLRRKRGYSHQEAKTGNIMNVEKDMEKFFKVLQDIPVDFKKQRSLYLRTLKPAADRLANVMKMETPDHTGRLQDSIKARRGRKIYGYFVGPQVNSHRTGFAGNWAWVAYGTRTRWITPGGVKNSATLDKMVSKDGHFAIPVTINGRVVYITNTGFNKPNNYAKRALDKSNSTLIFGRDKVQDAMQKRILTIMKQYGLKASE